MWKITLFVFFNFVIMKALIEIKDSASPLSIGIFKKNEIAIILL